MSRGAEPHIDQIREAAVRVITRVVLGLSWSFFAFIAVVDFESFKIALVPLGVPVVLASLLMLSSATYRARGWLVVGIVTALSMMSVIRIGLTPGGFALGVTAMVLAATLLGRRAAFVVLALSVASMALSATLFMAKVTPQVPLWTFDPLLTRNWLRVAIVYGASSVMAVLAVSFLLERLERLLQSREEVLTELREEQSRRQVLEEERTRERLAAAESQKLDALGRLAGGVAHDLRNMLSVIGPWLEVLASKPDEDSVKEAIDSIGQAVATSTEITSQLLTIARRQPGNPVALRLEVFVRDCVAGLARVLRQDIHLEQKLVTTPQLFLDPAQLQRVLLNLLLNARDAMPDGGTVMIETRLVPSSALPIEASRRDIDHVVLAVSDTGMGIDAATRARLFEPFFTTRAESGGTGLGLASVRGIAEQAGGYVRVDSTPGQGSCFEVGFPVPRELPAPPTASSQSAVNAQARVVLIVEDEPQVARAAERLFSLLGYRAHLSGNADEALAWLEKGEPVDLVSTDGRMPGLRVVEFLRILHERWPALPVMVCSGYMDSDLLEQQTGRRFAFLAKPFDLRSLERVVNEAFGRTPAATANRG